LGNLSELIEISLSHNQLRGPTPNEIRSLSRLKTVDFSSNALNLNFLISSNATKLNDVISVARGVPMSKAHISVGGYYDGL